MHSRIIFQLEPLSGHRKTRPGIEFAIDNENFKPRMKISSEWFFLLWAIHCKFTIAQSFSYGGLPLGRRAFGKQCLNCSCFLPLMSRIRYKCQCSSILVAFQTQTRNRSIIRIVKVVLRHKEFNHFCPNLVTFSVLDAVFVLTIEGFLLAVELCCLQLYVWALLLTIRVFCLQLGLVTYNGSFGV